MKIFFKSAYQNSFPNKSKNFPSVIYQNSTSLSNKYQFQLFSVLFILIIGLCHSFPDTYFPTIDSDTPTAPPKFVTRGHLYKAVIGDTIVLPCKVKDLGEHEFFVGSAKFCIRGICMLICLMEADWKMWSDR